MCSVMVVDVVMSVRREGMDGVVVWMASKARRVSCNRDCDATGLSAEFRLMMAESFEIESDARHHRHRDPNNAQGGQSQFRNP